MSLLFCPSADQGSAQNFDELGSAAYGRTGRVLIYCTVYIAIFGAPMLLHLTAAESESAMVQALACCCLITRSEGQQQSVQTCQLGLVEAAPHA